MSFQVGAYAPDNLASLLSEAQDNNLMAALGVNTGYEKTGLTYDEMLNFSPASLTTQYPNPAGLGASDSLNPVWYVLAAAALGYYFFVRPQMHMAF